MQPPEYVAVFQISRHSLDWLIACASLIPLVIGIALIIGKRRFRWSRLSWLFSIFFCVFGFCCALIVCGSVIDASRSKAFTAFQIGDYSIVEGVVTDFHPMPYAGHDEECFSVRTLRFCYSDYVENQGFHNAASHGGPVRNGLRVRLAYSGDIILRLEVAKGQALSASESKEAVESAKRQWEIGTENKPIQQRVRTAFLFSTVCLTLWWNLQWRLAMRFWVRPPNRPITQYGFRIFFGLTLIGAVIEFIEQLRRHPLTRQSLEATAATAAIMCCVVGSSIALVLWVGGRRDRPQI